MPLSSKMLNAEEFMMGEIMASGPVRPSMPLPPAIPPPGVPAMPPGFVPPPPVPGAVPIIQPRIVQGPPNMQTQVVQAGNPPLSTGSPAGSPAGEPAATVEPISTVPRETGNMDYEASAAPSTQTEKTSGTVDAVVKPEAGAPPAWQVWAPRLAIIGGIAAVIGFAVRKAKVI